MEINKPSGIDEVTNKSDIATTIEAFLENELDNTRYVLLVGINKKGAVFTMSTGFVSPLELQGLKMSIEDIIDDVIDRLDDD